MTPPVRRFIALFLLPAAVWAMACGLAYVQVQQVLRSGANDPQVQLAEDAAASLDRGTDPGVVVGNATVDAAMSLAPWITVYGPGGEILGSDATLDGRPPQVPAGVRASAIANGRDVVTWQPQPGLRIALVVVPFSGGTVASGRSLRLVEQREDQAELIAGAALVVGLGLIAALALLVTRIWPARPKPDETT